MNSKLINVSKLFREENMKHNHKFNIGEQVFIKNKEEEYYWIDNKSPSIVFAIKNNIPFFVVEHTRDCDGTPLYTLSLVPFPENTYHKDIIDKMILSNEVLNANLPLDTSIKLAYSAINIRNLFIIDGISEGVLFIKN